MFELARGYRDEAMSAYVRLQEREFAMEDEGYTAARHQREVGASYFDAVMETITGGTGSTLALEGLDRGRAVRPRRSRGLANAITPNGRPATTGRPFTSARGTSAPRAA